MDNKFGMEQQETEEDITKEKVFGWIFFVIVNVHFSSQHSWPCSTYFPSHTLTLTSGIVTYAGSRWLWALPATYQTLWLGALC